MSERVENMKTDTPPGAVDCRTGKRIYRSKSDAKHSASLISKASGKPARPYRCRLCRAYHLTTLTADEVAEMKDFQQRQHDLFKANRRRRDEGSEA